MLARRAEPQRIAHMTDLRGKRILIISRCARTLYIFRRSLIAEASKAGAEVIGLGAGGDGFEERLERSGVRFEHIPIAVRSVDLLADIGLLVCLVRKFRQIEPAVVHSFTVKPAIFATLAAWLAGVPRRVVTITGLGHAFTTAGPLVRSAVKILYRVALSRAHVVFFQNRDDKEFFIDQGVVRDSIARMIPGSGVDVDRFAPCPLPCATGAAPRFLMIARLLREKGVREYIQAAHLVKAEHPRATFTLLGGTDPRNPSALPEGEIAALQTSGEVEWVDEVTDVGPFIAAADVVVLPSYREGLPRTLLEGAAMGRALVATDAPGCREIVIHGETGCLVRVGDASSLAQAMARLCESPHEIAAMGRRARHLVETCYDQRLVNRACLHSYAPDAGGPS
jgi:glycosyltransferase involved in cell wall biosynthesis